jgi:protein-L-isoaspartate O-methyltransferase
VEEMSPLILAQLAKGGVILAPISSGRGTVLTRFQMDGDDLASEELGPSDAPPLTPGMAESL